ncbi:MAG: glycosyltransferase family 4 protein [Bacteroidetes bacterium]|nr:glycosyltransferase family 4 protein [Bacteroidota bacterium]
MNLLIDGIIFGRQRLGGISKVWEAYLKRLCDYDLKLKLIVPFRRNNPSLRAVLAQQTGYAIAHDVLYWPSRIFERVPVRSPLLQMFYLDRDIDIFHSTYLSTIYSNKIRKVVTVHDLIPELFERKQPTPWSAMVLEIRRRVFENADHLIAVSQNTRDDLLRCYPTISPEQVSLIYNGISTRDAIDSTLNQINEQHQIRLSAHRYYLVVGNRAGYKNFKLIRAWLEAHGSPHDVHVVCVGGEPASADRRDLAEGGLANHFSFLARVNDDALATLYRHALALIYPSKYEGFGLPVLEAMAQGCPVLCSRVSSLPEVGGEAALYFYPDDPASLDDAVRRLAQASRQTLQTKGRAQVARFSWDQSTRQLFELYQRL